MTNPSKNLWQNYIDSIQNLLKTTKVFDVYGEEKEINQAFSSIVSLAERCREEQGEIIFIGNGASAAIASHSAADIFKNAQIKTRVLTDAALITAMGNDLCYEEVYSTPLNFLLSEKDILVAISSSGNSPNIIEAAKVAQKKNASLISLSAFSPNNSLQKMGTFNFYVPAESYGKAETCHAAILHYWTDCLLATTHIQ